MASMTNKKKTSFKRTEKYQRTGYKFIAPGLLMMVLLIIYPMLYGAYLSFYNTNLVNKWKFVGFKYYLEAFTKPEFYTSVLFNLLVYVPCSWPDTSSLDFYWHLH